MKADNYLINNVGVIVCIHVNRVIRPRNSNKFLGEHALDPTPPPPIQGAYPPIVHKIISCIEPW